MAIFPVLYIASFYLIYFTLTGLYPLIPLPILPLRPPPSIITVNILIQPRCQSKPTSLSIVSSLSQFQCLALVAVFDLPSHFCLPPYVYYPASLIQCPNMNTRLAYGAVGPQACWTILLLCPSQRFTAVPMLWTLDSAVKPRNSFSEQLHV